MKILFVDDDENRIRKFCRAMIGHQVTVARSVLELIEVLGHGLALDVASFDHDLAGQIQPCGKECGCGALIWFLGTQGLVECYPPKIVLHSFNPDAPPKMARQILSFWKPDGSIRVLHQIATFGRMGSEFTGQIIIAKFGTDAYREAVGGNWE